MIGTAQRKRRTIALCLPIIGCLNGDFGRVRPSIVSDDIHAWLGPRAVQSQNISASQFRLTDDERLLRDLAYPLIEPAYDRQRWYSVINEYGLAGQLQPQWWVFDRTAYAAHLLDAWTRSGTTPYARLTDDVRNDITRIGPFMVTARRIIDMDVKRYKSLAYVSELTAVEMSNLQSRIAENALIVAWVQRSLIERESSYRFALERLVISVPAMPAIEAERALTLLHLRIKDARLMPVLPIAEIIPAPPTQPAIVTKG